jgi:hypothetical protein
MTDPVSGRAGLRGLASPRAADVLGAVTLVLFLVTGALTIVARQVGSSSGATAVVVLAFAGVGFVVARRLPRNPLGWILLGFGLLLVLSSAGGAYAFLVYQLDHRSLPFGPAGVLAGLLWSPAIVVVPLAILLFPDGRLPGSWRWVMRAYLLVGACWPVSIYAVAVSTIAGHRIHVDGSGDLTIIDQPTGSAAWLTTAQELILPVMVVFWLLFVIRQVVSYRGSSGERRAQLRWLMSGAAVCLVAAAIVTVGGSLFPDASALGQAVNSIASAATVAFPVSIGVGILKYRLYDIDRLISRTLAYAIVTALLAGCYVGVVALATDVLPFQTPVAVAASTLAVAALFNPLRHRVQKAVDRRFNRTRYDAQATVTTFAARLQDAVDLDTVRAELLDVVYRSLEPTHASIWVSQR